MFARFTDVPSGAWVGGLMVAIGMGLAGGCTSTQTGESARLASGRQEPVAVKNTNKAFVKQTEPNQFQVSLRDFPEVAAVQKEKLWCWAASAEMIHAFHGRSMPQAQIAERINKHALGKPKRVEAGGRNEIMLALNPDLIEVYTPEKRMALLTQGLASDGYEEEDLVTFLDSEAGRRQGSSDDLVNAFSRGEPVVIGLKNPGRQTGHACVAFAATYSRLKSNPLGITLGAMPMMRKPHDFALHRVWYVDPYTGETRTVDGAAFKEGVDFIMTASRARELLEQEMAALKGQGGVKTPGSIAMPRLVR